MPQRQHAPTQALNLGLTLGAAMDFALAGLFAFTDLIPFGDDFVRNVVVMAMLLAGSATLIARPFLLRKIGKHHPAHGNRPIIE